MRKSQGIKFVPGVALLKLQVVPTGLYLSVCVYTYVYNICVCVWFFFFSSKVREKNILLLINIFGIASCENIYPHFNLTSSTM